MKKKRKAPEPGGENDVEHWVMKRQKLKARKEEEAIKSKRTVFIGNLPVGCTKKVQRGRNDLNQFSLRLFALINYHRAPPVIGD